MIAAGSFDPDVVRRLVRHPRLARRYLAIEGHRALVGNADLLPRALVSIGDREIASRSDSPAASLSIATGRATVEDPATGFGVIRAAKVLAACSRATAQEDSANPQHVPRDPNVQGQEELDDDAIDESDDPDLFTSPVGGGGFIGKCERPVAAADRPARITRLIARTPRTAARTPCRRWAQRRARTARIPKLNPPRTA
jgi:nitric oxide reductase NorD protein